MNEITERPWGTYEVLLDAEDTKVKRIVVKPGQSPSYQYHYKRSEAWTIISGEGKLRLNGQLIPIYPGNTWIIQKEDKHCPVNTSESEDLVFIEVQTGEYFGEDDIVRISDKYGREDK